MFQHILVPLDGSPQAEQVLPAVARLTRASEALLTLLTVVDIAHEAISYSMAGPYIPPNTLEQDLALARTYLDQVSQRSDLVGVSLEKQVDLGNPAMMMLSRAEVQTAQPIDLIVMPSHGYIGVKQWLCWGASPRRSLAMCQCRSLFCARVGRCGPMYGLIR